MKIVTLAFFVEDKKILLAMKKRGFGAGKWNGYGGKLDEGETVTEAAVREIKEESGAQVAEGDLKHMGAIDFYFDDKAEWNQRVEVFRVTKWKGLPEETEEMKPEWFDFDKIPWKDMWKGDDEWIPHFLRGEHFSGEVHFALGGQKVVSVKVSKIT